MICNCCFTCFKLRASNASAMADFMLTNSYQINVNRLLSLATKGILTWQLINPQLMAMQSAWSNMIISSVAHSTHNHRQCSVVLSYISIQFLYLLSRQSCKFVHSNNHCLIKYFVSSCLRCISFDEFILYKKINYLLSDLFILS